MAWLNGATDLATCVKSVSTGVSAGASGDWGTLGASAATIVGKGLIYAGKQNAVLAKALKESGTKILPTPTAIVDAAALAVTVVDFLNGFGTPNAGAAVATAAKDLDAFMKNLDPGCIPDSRDWNGSAAAAYIGQVTLLKAYAQTMKEYDSQLKNQLGEQAASVKQAHLCCTVNVAVLTAAAGVALLLYLIPVVGPGISQAWQIVAAFACCAAVFVVEMLTLSSSMSISNSVAALAQQYVQLGKDVDTKLEGTYGKIQGKIATETSSELSRFRGISDGLTGYSFAPSLEELARRAGGGTTKPRPAPGDSTGNQPSTGIPSGTPTTPSTPSTPSTPTAGAGSGATPGTALPPGLAALAQLLTQLSLLAQPLNQLGQTLSQGASQVQQVVQSAKGAGDPAPAAATTVDDVKDAESGAAAGGAGAERAPVGAAASAAEPAEAGRERVL